MGSPLPPDPYLALGVPKDVTTAIVKATHRKLVLKCHPDKVTDPDAKQAAADQFHIIQSAYEILVDEDRRARYDAQVRLAELRKEALLRQSGGGSRGHDSRPTPPYRGSHDSAMRDASYSRGSERVAPSYEERRPPHVEKDYFDSPPRATARKEPREPEYEHVSRRSSHDVKEKVRASTRDVKENERADRREKTKRSERDTRQERDRKYSSYAEVATDSESDDHSRRPRRPREDEHERRDREAAREAYYEKVRRQREEAGKGYYADDRARKMFQQDDSAKEYILNSRSRQHSDSERRPSPVRAPSNKDRVESIKRSAGADRPAAIVRQHSSRPSTSGRDAEPARRSTRDVRQTSMDLDDPPRRPPILSASKSSPADIHIPPEKPRAKSLQPGSDAMPIPVIVRAETMPYKRSQDQVPTKASISRPTEVHEGLPTPGATPTYTDPSSPKFVYGKQYADDSEKATPDGYRTVPAPDAYRTEYREPAGSNARPSYARRVTRSPSPVREPREARETRERPRAASARQESYARPTPLRTTSTKAYLYNAVAQGVEHLDRPSRPSTAARPAPRETLYGELPSPPKPESRPATGSPRNDEAPFPPPPPGGRYTRELRPDMVRLQSGHGSAGRRGGQDHRPSFQRSASTVHAR